MQVWDQFFKILKLFGFSFGTLFSNSRTLNHRLKPEFGFHTHTHYTFLKARDCNTHNILQLN
jgi:hypothetical protein